MNVRLKMRMYRQDNKIDIPTMAWKCKISQQLLEMLEEGAVTSPSIVERVAKAYGLDELEAEELMPLNHRKHGGQYDPDKYVVPDPHEVLANRRKKNERENSGI